MDELLKKGIIIRKDTNRITGQKRFYRIDWDVLGDFDKEEKKFVKLFIERFWNPKVTDPVISINELLLEALFIKKIYKVKEENILNYYPKKDLEEYDKNTDRFWNEEKFRDNFLDKLFKIGEKKFSKKGFSELYIKWDFIFLSTLIPETIFDKLSPEYRNIGSPIYTAVAILDFYNKEKKYQCSKCSHQFNELSNKCPNCGTELQKSRRL